MVRTLAVRRVALAIVIAAVLLPALVPSARAQGGRVLVADIDGAIDRSTLDYVAEAIEEAQRGGYAALVLRFDTPGGGLDETLSIANLMVRAANLPILGFVGPVGASSVSAGTILLMASDLAAMAPGTTIGSVQPVVLGPGGFTPVTDAKIINYVVEKLEEQMRLHGRNESLARRFVEDNWNLNATDARDLGATEIVARTIEDFLARAHGRNVIVGTGGTVYKNLTLDVAGATLVSFSPSARVAFLAVLSDPLVSSLLLILGIYTLIFGLSAPGHGAEIAGVILLLLALIGLGFSVDPVALFLIVLGVALIIIELKTPGFGAFGVGGIVAMVLGAVFLAPLRPPQFVVSPEYQVLFLVALLVPTAAFGGFLLFAVYKVMEIRRRKPTIGAMVGEPATVVDPIRAGEKGYVMHRGELWQALPAEDVAKDETVFIHAVDGITLRVSRSAPPVAAKPALASRFRRLLGPKPPG
ncbi:MAG: nodulation protein NfeD [Thermoplasmata archaeon]